MTRATSFGFGRYRAVLSLPGIRPLLVAAFVGRLPVAMLSLAIVLLVSEQTGSYAIAGAVSATQALASAVFSPLLGRLIDRLGQTRVLVSCAIVFPISVAALITVAEVQPEPLPLIACAIPFGISFPPLFAALRALLGQLAGRADLTESAYALEAVMQELFFISGPLLVAVLVAVASPQVALAAAAALTSVGTLAFAAMPASREWRAERRQSHSRGRRARLARHAHAAGRERCVRPRVRHARGDDARVRRSSTERRRRRASSWRAPRSAAWRVGSGTAGGTGQSTSRRCWCGSRFCSRSRSYRSHWPARCR